VDKLRQLEDMCVELKAANSTGNFRKLFETVRQIRKFQPRLHCNQTAMGEYLADSAQIADTLCPKNVQLL